MANYTAPFLTTATTSTFKSTGVLVAAGRRAMVYEAEIGQPGTPATSDFQCLWDLSRIANTTGLTIFAGGLVAANLLDPADVVATTLFYNQVNVEPTNVTNAGNGLNLKQWGINQRGSYRWRALDDGDNIILASTATQGVTVRMLSAGYLNSVTGTISFIER